MSNNFSYIIVECNNKWVLLESKDGEQLTIPQGWLPSPCHAGSKVVVTANDYGNRGQVWLTVIGGDFNT
jgi:hypothetical protein